MSFKVATILSLAAFCASPLLAEDEAEASATTELDGEIAYVEALVDAGYPDFAAPVIEATKKRWPESEARFFAIEIRGLLALGKFADAEKKIASLPDRRSTKFWAARLEVANNYYARGQMDECVKIYDEFFKVFPKPPKDIFKFYMDACFTYGQLLIKDKRLERAAQIYESVLPNLKDEKWCDLAVETAEIYLRLADEAAGDVKKRGSRDKYLASATKLADKMLWFIDLPLIFGRAVSMKAHIEQIKGDVEKAAALIDEYMPRLQDIHNQIVQVDPEGRFGLLRTSPLPECRYLQAKMRWDEAQKLAKQPKRDDARIKDLMFGPRGKDGKRQGSKGAFNIAVSIFLNYETSAWAPAAGDLSEEIKAFAEKTYHATVKTKVTPEQIAKVRAAQFKSANALYVDGEYAKAIEAYYAVLAKYPELPESLRSVENIVNAYLDLIVDEKDEKKRENYRIDADAVEGYLAERFAGAKDKVMMSEAGNAVIRIAAKEQERREYTRADRLYTEFFTNYRKHTTAPTLAASKAMEMRNAEKYEDAVKYFGLIVRYYSNTTYYATALAQLSDCYGKLGDKQNEIGYITKYLSAETVNIRRLQAQFRLAQMYQKDGLAILAAAETNATPEAVEQDERRGTAQIVRAIKQFTGFSSEAEAALKDPATPAEDLAKYKELREAALFMVGECWGRMNRPEKNLKNYRAKAAASYEAYLEAYPDGKYSKFGYVKLGTIYTALGDLEKSKSALDRLSERFPDSDEAKDAKPRLAKSLIEMGLKKEGTEIYAEMLHTDGKYTANQFVNAGEALIDAKSWDLANQAFEKAIRLAGTNQNATVAKSRLGQAKSAWKQGSFAEARESLDLFLADPKMAKMAIAAEANFMLVNVASDQGRTEKDATMRGKYFGAAIGALKKVRQYWKNKPQWEQDQLDLLSGDVLVDRMKAEDAMNLKDDAKETCGKAAAVFQVFIQAHGVSEQHPIDKMEAGEIANLERAYATMIPLFTRLGSDQADRVMKFGQEYLDLFPNGKARTEIANCMNQAKADLPAAGAANKGATAPTQGE